MIPEVGLKPSQMNHTLISVLTLRTALEYEIAKAISKFEQTTGILVDDISIHRTDVTYIGCTTPQYVVKVVAKVTI